MGLETILLLYVEVIRFGILIYMVSILYGLSSLHLLELEKSLMHLL